ncbi:hypothetical protein PFICI_05506 [Pestalotiopsis fici W106-1]|uniref:CENP-V/GFA domain-containing protein n=1 Tax=Pestalotiopsis fici (strain W106-1 / CGMCC3.15140) TaxID=1229662 RepID=W3XC52_PESFW|nr:uncharacterized protein PFICI_05506 [Pestalotiopsis fici W106-1]ETS83630.1 hypothetical protein PFICI_05506 [Pestalotiopsis fici W106-1]
MPPTEQAPSTVLSRARCYCGSLDYGVSLPREILPLSAYICHCSRCRYIHGAISITHATLPKGSSLKFFEPSSLALCATQYRPQGSKYYHYFCSTCGCHLGGRDEHEDVWYLSIVLFPYDESVFRIDKHCFTASAPGGLHEWLPSIADRPLDIMNPVQDTHNSQAYKSEVGSNGKERLRAQCDCGGISFTIQRPTQEVLEDAYMRGYVSPEDPTKWKAMTDACNDCRLITSTVLSAWAYVPLKLIEPRIGPDLMHGTMKSYISSPGSRRTFCRVCGATTLYWSDTRHTTDDDHVIGIAIGLLRAPEGINAIGWLTWRTAELGWLDAGSEYAKSLYHSLNQGHQDWSIRAFGRLVDFKLPKPDVSTD